MSETRVTLYKFPGESVSYNLSAAGSSGNVVYSLLGTGYDVTVSPSGLLTWLSTDSNSYNNLMVNVQEDPCGFIATLSVTLTVHDCPCSNGGTCISSGPPTNTFFSCICPEGFDGILCQNNLKDECTSSPCMNGGTCIDRENAFTCSCTPKYSGTNCEVELEGWSDWSEWGACDAQTCVRSRSRTCVIPPCDGVSTQYECCPGCYSTGLCLIELQ